ncbi:prostatic acid phosphatase-like [Argonauta hians]
MAPRVALSWAVFLWLLQAAWTPCEAQAAADPSLRLVQVLYRHGDRSPTTTFPKDDADDLWPNGLGQLTKVGMRQQYELGKYLRQRYGGFINTTFNTEQMVVRSTDKDRTLMSAYCNLAGLFAPSPDDMWNPDLRWQPVPVHTVPKYQDKLLYMEAQCPQYYHLYTQFLQSQQYHSLMAQYEDLMEYVSLKSGVKPDAEDVSSLYDNFFCRQRHNISLPSWVTAQTMASLEQLHVLKMKAYFYTPHMQKLKGGYLLWDIMENMNLKVTEPDTRRRLVMYSAHDSTLVALMMSMNVFNNILPPYASCLIVELHQHSNQSYYVEIFYRNSTHHPPVPITLPGCQQQCVWNQFVRITEEAITEDIEGECQIPQHSTPMTTAVMCIVFVVLFVVFAIILVRVFRTYRGRREGYQQTRI